MRYFIFFYFDITTGIDNSFNWMQYCNEKFPKQSVILHQCSFNSPSLNMWNIRITNWIEFNNEEDFNNYFEL